MVTRRLRALLGFLLAAGILLPAVAFACPVMDRADPKVGSEVKKSPHEVALHFTGPIDIKGSQLSVQNAAGETVSTGKPQGRGETIDTIYVPVKNLKPGNYKVEWHVKCECENKTKSVYPGDYSFIVH